MTWVKNKRDKARNQRRGGFCGGSPWAGGKRVHGSKKSGGGGGEPRGILGERNEDRKIKDKDPQIKRNETRTEGRERASGETRETARKYRGSTCSFPLNERRKKLIRGGRRAS